MAIDYSKIKGALRARGCAEFFGIGESTWWHWVQTGKVPAGIKIGNKTTVWRIADLEALLTQPAAAGAKR
ncbi:MAG: AlpA family phage regulatory protein [Candidatus Adiutrix sp.]|jgi:predicted DNA-binding transcriptional regulator AlpA|nr:AlpA family phage regulatory protein [Candidatus Adiutrix sp.]